MKPSSGLMQPVRQAWSSLASRRPGGFSMLAPTAPRASKQQPMVPTWLNASSRRPDALHHSTLSTIGRGIRRFSALEELNIFDVDVGSHTIVQSYSEQGFLVNHTLVSGAMILMPQTFYHWKVEDIKDLTWESLSIIRVLAVKPGEI